MFTPSTSTRLRGFQLTYVLNRRVFITCMPLQFVRFLLPSVVMDLCAWFHIVSWGLDIET